MFFLDYIYRAPSVCAIKVSVSRGMYGDWIFFPGVGVLSAGGRYVRPPRLSRGVLRANARDSRAGVAYGGVTPT